MISFTVLAAAGASTKIFAPDQVAALYQFYQLLVFDLIQRSTVLPQKAVNLPNELNHDAEHLRLLSIFHYVVAGMTAFVSFFPLLYTGMGALFVYLSHQPVKPGESLPPEVLGWFLVGFGIFLAIIGFAFAVVIFLAGRALAQRRRYWFAFVVACMECIFIPFGTILGVFTLIVLSRESAKSLFLSPGSTGRAQT